MQTTKIKIPLRVSFTGTICDIPKSLGGFRGSAICAPIDKFVEVEFVDDTSRPPYIYPESDSIKSTLSRLSINRSVQIRWRSDIEMGMGLGGSAALSVAVARYFLRHWQDQAYIAGCIEIDNNGGWQDPTVVSYGRMARFSYLHDGFGLQETFSPLGSEHFMLISTGKRHETRNQYKELPKVSSEYLHDNEDRVNRFASAVRLKDYESIGKITTETYHIKQNQIPNYVDNKMDEFFHEALNFAYGGRLMGSGGGGCFIFALPIQVRESLKQLAEGYGYRVIPFSFYDKENNHD